MQGAAAIRTARCARRTRPASSRAGCKRAVSVGRPADRAARAAGRLRPEGAAGPPSRHRVPVRAGGAAHRRGRRASPSIDLTTAASLCRSNRPPGRTPRRSWSAVVTTPTPLHPEGITRVVLLGDPTKALGTVAEPECRRIVAALDLAEREGHPGGVVRAVGRRADLHGQRHREHGLDRRGRCAGSSSSPRPAARSTSSWPASTSAPSRTGTPRPPCSCTPRASW